MCLGGLGPRTKIYWTIHAWMRARAHSRIVRTSHGITNGVKCIDYSHKLSLVISYVCLCCALGSSDGTIQMYSLKMNFASIWQVVLYLNILISGAPNWKREAELKKPLKMLRVTVGWAWARIVISGGLSVSSTFDIFVLRKNIQTCWYTFKGGNCYRWGSEATSRVWAAMHAWPILVNLDREV